MKSFDFVKREIQNDEVLKSIKTLLNGQKAWLVGGYIRDLFLNIKSFDRDIVVLSNAQNLAKNIANELEATLVELDCENEIYRVVLKDKKNYLDISLALDSNILKDVKIFSTHVTVFWRLSKKSLFVRI